MTTLDRKMVSEAVRLFEGRAISAAEADELRAECGSREDFLEELWFHRGSLARSPDLASAVGQARKYRWFPGGRAERAFYEGVLARIDPSEAMALFVPRWGGVAAATQCLFTQAVPIPATATQHPDELGATDIASYANLLLASGGRHFVISGGDNFHLALIENVLQRDSRIRFDLVWHSNYLQMGEEHAGGLLWRWLRAHEDGLIT
ncbi:MAG: hypothetical protein JOY71_28885, partial [Acetobacteraceae bacterium]|nr:hypothetical protein [Acetobacteraceae bacterium]